jgi:two-component system chemotaxis sensor kinase CheA
MFRAGSGVAKVLPLSVVSRIEMVEASRIESSDGRLTVLLQGRLTPVLLASSEIDLAKSCYPVLVVTAEERTIGLLADEIIDIIEDQLDIQLASPSADIVGAAEIGGQTVELVDIAHFVARAYPSARKPAAARKVLLVADNVILRDMLAPSLAAAGYIVSPVGPQVSPQEIVEQALHCDVVVLDVDASGFAASDLVRELRENHGSAPVIAVAGNPTPHAQRKAARDGFASLVSKLDRSALLDALAFALEATADDNETAMEFAA